MGSEGLGSGELGCWESWVGGVGGEELGSEGLGSGVLRSRWTLGQMGIGGKWPPVKMSTRANGHFGQLGQMSTLGELVFGPNGRPIRDKWH